MKLSEVNQNTHQFPSTSFIDSLKNHKFKTLNQALSIIHNAEPTEKTPRDKFRLKSFDGKNIHLFQCCKPQCKSHILFKSQIINKNMSKNSVEFEIFEFKNLHNHTILKQVLDPWDKTQKSIDLLSFHNQEDSETEQNMAIDKFEYIRLRLRKYDISIYFRDYLNCFSQSKKSDPGTNLPYTLPQIFSSKQIEVVLKTGFKCLNEKKKTYFFIIEVFAFGDIYTEVKYVTPLKSKNPQIYIYTLTLIYILLNNIQNCTISMEGQTLNFIKETKLDAKKLQIEKKVSQQQFIRFLMTLESDFFIDCTEPTNKEKSIQQGHIKKRCIQEKQRMYNSRKYISSNSQDDSDNSFMSTDQEKNKFGLSPFMKKIYIRFQDMEFRQVKSIKNKCIIAQSTYSQATIGKNGQWHVCQEKPSILQKLNDLYYLQEVKRLKKEKNKQKKSFSQDANIIALSSDQSEDQNVKEKLYHNKEYRQKQQSDYINEILNQTYGNNMQIKESQQKKNDQKIEVQQKLLFFNDEMEEKPQKITNSVNLSEDKKIVRILSSESEELQDLNAIDVENKIFEEIQQ